MPYDGAVLRISQTLQIPFETYRVFYFIRTRSDVSNLLIKVETVKALCSLNDRVKELLIDDLFVEALGEIRNWIDQAKVNTNFVDVQAKITETDNIVCLTFAFIISTAYFNPMPFSCWRIC